MYCPELRFELEVGVAGQHDVRFHQSSADFRAGQRIEFAAAAFLQSRGSVPQLIVAESGMAHKFRDALGKAPDQLRESRGIVTPGKRESGEMIGGAATAARQLPPEKAKAGQGTAYPGDLELLGQPGNGAEHGRQHVGVLVGIQMSWPDSGFYHPGDLSS